MKNWMCDCEKQFDTKKQMIEHYKRVHPDSPERCYDQIGETWNITLTRLVKNMTDERHRADENLRSFNNIQEKYNDLIQKHNAIILILQK
jgi:hypothetical protein